MRLSFMPRVSQPVNDWDLSPLDFFSGSKASALSTVCFDTLGRFIAHLGKKNWQLLLRNMEVCWKRQIQRVALANK